ncbi:hypothetical protein SNE40_019694 [Patella caerulea]|uniref:Ankyrin repeat domain-containing protein 6 n=1 Tax=Patella caerulea TaxID=87958 RepID=A0AAN8J7X9_PATCE
MSTGVLNQNDGHSPVILQSLEGRLRLAASKGQTEEIENLLKAGATFEPDREGRTALHYSSQNGYLEACKILIRNGCSTDCQDVLGYTPLHRCVAQGNLEIAELLLNEGCCIDVQDQHGNTAVHEAAWNGYSKSLELLVKHNSSVHLPNKAGFTALHLASQAGHNESSRVLLYAGCNPDSKNNYGDTALHTAARYGHAGVTRILISARCRLNEQNKNGDTSLHITAALRRRKIAKLLVEAHIDISIKNKQNETAVEVAKRKEHPEIILIITSFSRPRTPRHTSREREQIPGQVAFKDEIEMIDGPIVVPEDHPPIKTEKPEEKKRFFFFKRKKKDKDKDKEKPVAQDKPTPNIPRRKVEGFFSQYVPKQGVQYYRDLAGNIKQGPIGYSPACQCGPSLKKLENDVEKTKGNLYEHIDASHQILSQRIDHLDQRTAQQVYAIDKLTKERLDQERQACHNRITERIEEEWSGNRNVLSQYNQQIQSWLDDKMDSYGHCLDHHHDDSALPSRNIFFDFHQNANGRLFKSRSDETLSDCSGKNRKKNFYESRQAAMRQIRGWDVSFKKDGAPQKERNNNHVTQAQVHPNKNNMDRKADGASPKYEENANTTYHDFNYPGGVRKDKSEGAIPKQSANQKWQRAGESVTRPPTVRPRQSSQFDSQLYRSMSRAQIENRNSRRSNLAEGGVPNISNVIGARDSSLGTTYNGTGAYNSSVSKHYDQNRNYRTSAYNSRPLSPNYRLAKSSDPLNQDQDLYPSGIPRSKSVERTIDSPDRAEHSMSPQRKSVTFLDRVTNKTPTPFENGEQRPENPVNNSPYRKYDSTSTFKQDELYSSANEIRKLANSVNYTRTTTDNRLQGQPYGTVTSASKPVYKKDTPAYNRQYPSSTYNYQVRNNVDNGKTENSLTNKDVILNGSKSPVHHPSNFIPYAHSSPSQVVYNPAYVNKEDSTCSSNPDSGYSSKGIGQGNQSVSCTPSSSFSADRSLSIGTPSNSNSPCLTNNPMDFHLPKPSVMPNNTNTTQSHSWYERKLLEAAEKMRKTNQYNDYDNNTKSYNELYVSLNYDPVHGSDV